MTVLADVLRCLSLLTPGPSVALCPFPAVRGVTSAQAWGLGGSISWPSIAQHVGRLNLSAK